MAIKFWGILGVGLFLLAIVSTAQAKYSGGTGEPNDPYQIATAADLILLGDSPADYDKHFVMTANIDLAPSLPGRKVFDKAVIAPDTDPTKGDFQGTFFTGVFDGDGHTISHLTITGKDYLGLFGCLGYEGGVKHLAVVDVNIIGSGHYVGGLVGMNGRGEGAGATGGITTRCYTTGAVSGAEAVGGLVGDNSGTVTQCYSTGAVSDGRYRGVSALLGGNYGAAVVGGLVGENSGDVTQCYSTGAVGGTGQYGSVGGLVGSNGGTVTYCYSTGAVGGTNAVGGLVGGNNKWGTVTQCYSTGGVSGTGEYGSIGGLVGNNGGTVTHCYSTGAVSGTGEYGSVGGLVGVDCYGHGVTACFWDTQTSGQAKSSGGTGKTTVEMRTASTFLPWSACGAFWTIDEGRDYPHLAWESMPGVAISRLTYGGGAGTDQEPYLIYTAEDLNVIGLSSCHCDKHFKLMADIDLSGFDGKNGRPAFHIIAPGFIQDYGGFAGIPFTGVFDGNGHRISHLTVKGGGCLGLFGQLASGAEVKDLGVVDVNIVGSDRCVGGLVGSNAGNVIRCYITGAVSGTSYVGGLAGHNDGTMTECTSTAKAGGTGDSVGGLAGRNTGTATQCCNGGGVSSSGINGRVGGLVGFNDNGVVTRCYSTGPVGGSQFVGGLVGYNCRGTVTHCYSTGPVSGNNFIGGAVGYNDYGPVTRCYSIGAVRGEHYLGGLVGSTYFGIALNSFWDTQTSGQRTSAGGTGKTTAEMQAAKTFRDAGWDFVGETANGMEDTWWILEGKDYPRLWWELFDNR